MTNPNYQPPAKISSLNQFTDKTLVDLKTWLEPWFMGLKGKRGRTGASGADGADGIPGGAITIPFTFSTTTTVADPGSGVMRFNNATQGFTTTVVVDNNNSFGQDMTSLYGSIDDTFRHGQQIGNLRVVNRHDETKFYEFAVTSAASASGYYTFTVVRHSQGSVSSQFVNGDDVLFMFTPAGKDGFGGAVTLRYLFDPDTSLTNPDPGYLRLNNVDPALATEMNISVNGYPYPNGGDWTVVFANALAESTSEILGQIRIFGYDQPDGNFALYDLTGVTNSVGHSVLDVVYLGGSFTTTDLGDQLLFTFIPKGDKGDRGTSGGIQYIFSSTTTDSDPGNGRLRLSNATQTSATVIRADLLDDLGVDYTAVLDSFDDSTNTVKGNVLIVNDNDATKWLAFTVSAVASPSGYRNITVANTAGSSSSPFSDGDIIRMFYSRAGDTGINGTDGGAITIGYTLSTTTTDSDPGAGNLRLNQATQNTATVIRADLLDNLGSDWTNALATFDDSTSAVLGFIRLVKKTDASKFLLFSVSAVASPSGYRNITVSNVASSASSPFSNGDSILLCFTRTGDKGSSGGSGVNLVTTFAAGAGQTYANPGASYVGLRVICIGPGGGGGGGASSVGTAKGGGTGGGGGCTTLGEFRISDLTFPITINVGSGTTGGTGGAAGAGASGGNSTDAGTTAFGAYLLAGGGGKGIGGIAGNSVGGGGGGSAASAVAGAGGTPAAPTTGIAGQGAPASSGANGAAADFGGGSGGGSTTAASRTGGDSINGGPGGGAGGLVSAGNAGGNGAAGGGNQLYSAGGAANGGSGGTSPQVGGGTLNSFTGPYCGNGGGGGGGGSAGHGGGNGGPGGRGAGGGGGGSGSNSSGSANKGGDGGNGGDGICIVFAF